MRENMKIFVATESEYDSFSVEGLFTDETSAKNFQKAAQAIGSFVDIDEYEVVTGVVNYEVVFCFEARQTLNRFEVIPRQGWNCIIEEGADLPANEESIDNAVNGWAKFYSRTKAEAKAAADACAKQMKAGFEAWREAGGWAQEG